MSLSDKLREFSLFHRTSYLVHGDWLELIGEAERLEAQNARLRELVREAYEEGFDDGGTDAVSLPYQSTGMDQSWETSAAKAALDAMDKEGADEA